MKLTFVPTPQEFEQALESWAWIGLADKRPWFASLFGDVFFEADDGVWYLDRLEGTLTREWESRTELEAALETEAGHDRYLLGALAIAAHNAGKVLGPNQVYDFTPPPILGGPVVVDNISVMDFVVSVNLAGQIHDQVRGLPPGSAVTEFRIEEPKPKRRGLFRRR